MDASTHPSNEGEDDAEVDDARLPDGAVVSCTPKTCGVGQRCEDGKGCIDKACSELECGAQEECADAPGGGHHCQSVACSSDADCSAARHCNGTICVDDVCEPNRQRCDGERVFQCTSSGGEEVERFTCQGAAYFTSSCKAGAALGGCPCEDDWDCPSFTGCNAGRCQGTGVAPACVLAPVPIERALPTLEFRWGGESATNPAAVDRAFPSYSQVLMTPVVANLDDDNGDGVINELDFPEIVFMAYMAVDRATLHSGTLRAVHAGGPKRGRDYFALCGDKRWFEGDPVAGTNCAPDEGITRPGGGIAVGDLDYDGVPEIVVATERGTLQILDNRGRLITESTKQFPAFGDAAPNDNAWVYPQVGLSNLDNSELVEIVLGNLVFTLEKPSGGGVRFVDVFTGPASTPGDQPSEGAQDDDNRHFGPTACPANLVDTNPSDMDASQELVVGTVLYAMPQRPAGVSRRAQCASGDTSDYCRGRLRLVWDARVVNGTDFNTGVPYREGYCAVADVLSANGASPSPSTPLDGVPEVVLVSNGRVFVLRGDNGQMLRRIEVEPQWRGGAPNVDDFDGDGFPEVAMASNAFYTVIDLQEPAADTCPAWGESLGASAPAPGTNPARAPGGDCSSNAQCNPGAVCNTSIGKCVCLHNGWRRVTEDDSSRATSSSVFDFNGDGAAEVVYNDECYFRVYDGATGTVRLAIPSVSRTGMENPLVADVDNDGNAEIVFVSNNEYLRCDQNPLLNPDGSTVPVASLPNGIQVWGDASDTWVSARRIWNQHAYHVTNVSESAQIPLREPESWKRFAGRFYNTYRSQPRTAGLAPDLALSAMQVSSPNAACQSLASKVEIVTLVKNLGDLRVGPGVALSFYGDYGEGFVPLHDQSGKPLTSTLTASLEPGASILVSANYDIANESVPQLPSRFAAEIDEAHAERECRENNNRVEYVVDKERKLTDLALRLDQATGPCDGTEVVATLQNVGSVAASNVLVRLYAGDPSAGGNPIGEETIPGPIPPGGSASTSIALVPIRRDIIVYGIADPLGAIMECNNANNVSVGPVLSCYLDIY